MEALAARLSHLDAEAGGAVRVVMFYDTLMRRRVDLPALVRASANLAECVAAVRLDGSARTVRMAPDGRPAPEPSSPPSVTVPITLDDERIGCVWLERAGTPAKLDDLLLDRLAIAAAAVVERHGPAPTTMADPALVELVISPGTDEPTRTRALKLLGLATDRPLRVAAIRSTRPLDQVAAALCPARPVKAAPLGDIGVILATTVDAERLPPEVRAGIGAAESAERSWCQARTALRFAAPHRPVVHHRDLGAAALLEHAPPEALRANGDVAAIERIAADPDDLATLDAYCATGSRRRAAELLHLHHSSVARRIDRLGTELGMELTESSGLVRATLALTAWRLTSG
ncbi:helix-turn-helix domain-containing protein [Saccharopolyspora dendranthemae]|uniref:Regulatory helix-turn-helix LysR family protein n=1 Tax=Saccharopolyspora dendranthemae TaxID=1181886 RepID=A0A561U8X1_9PSEU|nr:LysR family transcriptional regulator [Saccharopolyspora dendranthemae]TWF95812.1 regulatory helix-turn-helix LysR family protein [Saccharopolyspora dendranthemae]